MRELKRLIESITDKLFAIEGIKRIFAMFVCAPMRTEADGRSLDIYAKVLCTNLLCFNFYLPKRTLYK